MTTATAIVNAYGVIFTFAEWSKDRYGCIARARGEARREGAKEYEVLVVTTEGPVVVRRGKV